MTYHEAFDHTGKRRIFRRPTAHRVVNVLLAIGGIVVWAALTQGWMA